MAQHTYFRRVRYIPTALVGYAITSTNDATVHYYGKTTFSSRLPFSEAEMDDFGFVPEFRG